MDCQALALHQRCGGALRLEALFLLRVRPYIDAGPTLRPIAVRGLTQRPIQIYPSRAPKMTSLAASAVQTVRGMGQDRALQPG
jgi:hypothetical protein